MYCTCINRLSRSVLALALFALTATTAIAESTVGACLTAYDDQHQQLGPCPLKHTDVKVDISGFIARVTLTQEYANPYPNPIEAVYTFPMSERAAVDAMTMTTGDRTIKGLIKEREAARQIYEAAKNAGQTASLLDQERPNIFTQSLANIMPGNAITITISYVEFLVFRDGDYRFAFPMVVGPRYIPGNASDTEPKPLPIQPEISLGKKAGPESTDQVPDAGRVNPPITPEGVRAGHDISLTVNLDAGVELRDIKSELHEVDIEKPSTTRAVVRLRNQKEIPNRDFILTYGVGGEAIQDAVLTHTNAQGGFFTMILNPPARVRANDIKPKEMMFVIDCSGSMSGFPIEKAKAAMRQCIEQMNPNDTFNLVTFAGGLGYCFETVQPNTPANRQKALDYLANLEGGGGTEMMPAIHAALGGQSDPERLRVVCFMTDGYIGNDMEIIDAIQKSVDKARVFSFGIGSSVNRFLIEGMARAGRGTAEIVSLERDPDETVARFAERIHNPVLTDIQVDFGKLPVHDLYPASPQDLFSAQPIILCGRYDGEANGKITLHGKTANGDFERVIPVSFPKAAPNHDVLATLWARSAVEDLMYKDWLGAQRGNPDADIKAKVTKIGLDFSILTQYTSFVAVEERVVNKNGTPTKVEVPVEMPDGVSYEGIFGEESDGGLQRPSGMSLGYAMPKLRAKTESLSDLAAAPATVAPLSFESAPTRQNAAAGEAELISQLAEMPKDESAEGRVDAGKPAKSDADATVKLHPSLVGLAGKVKEGSFQDDSVTVANGTVKVSIVLADLSDATLKALKDLGVKQIALRQAGKTMLANVPVAVLEKLVAMKEVVRIDPA